MHKKICYAIKFVVKNTPYNSGDIFDVRIHKKKTIGFWSMEIIFGEDYARFQEHLISISRSIGLFYGETLFITSELSANKKPYKIIIS